MAKQLVFIDDSGDPGFVCGVSSANLVLAGVLFADPAVATALNQAISEYRKSLGWRENHEFKFHNATRRVKLDFLKLVCQYNFKVYAVYVNKAAHPRAMQISDREKIYNWTMKELLRTMPLDNAYVKIDGRASREHRLKVMAYLRKEVNVDGCKIKEIKPQDSMKDNLIQLADMMVGAINRSFQPEKTDAMDYVRIIKRKIATIKELGME